MPQSLSQNIVHIIFSTKNRRPCLAAETRERLYPYMSNLIRERRSECYRIGGVEDHVHLAVRLTPTMALSKFISEVKTGTSAWLKTTDSTLADFGWQDGYGAFSVGRQNLDALIHYIDHQEEHHKKEDFQAEFRKFLQKYGIEYDENYVWG